MQGRGHSDGYVGQDVGNIGGEGGRGTLGVREGDSNLLFTQYDIVKDIQGTDGVFELPERHSVDMLPHSNSVDIILEKAFLDAVASNHDNEKIRQSFLKTAIRVREWLRPGGVFLSLSLLKEADWLQMKDIKVIKSMKMIQNRK